MFICICRVKEEEDDEIRIDFADDKLNSRDCIYSFLSIGFCMDMLVRKKIIQSRCVIFLLYMCGDFKINQKVECFAMVFSLN